MKHSIKSKIILFTFVFAVIFAVTLFFATNSFATEEAAEADATPTTTEEEAVIEDAPEATETNEAAVTEPAAQPNLDTVETPLGDTGLKLIGNRAAQSPTDFEESTGDYIINTEGWTLSGISTIEQIKFYIKCKNISLENLGQAQNGIGLTIYLALEENYNNSIVNIIGNNVNVYWIIGNFNYSLVGTGTLDIGATNHIGKRAGTLYCANGNISIEGPTVLLNLNYIDSSAYPLTYPVTVIGDLLIKAGALRCSIDNTLYPAIITYGKIEVHDLAELFAASNCDSYTVYSYSETGITELTKYKTSTDFLPYEKKSQVSSLANLIPKYDKFGDTCYSIGVADTETPAKTVYKPAGNPPEPTPPEPTPTPASEELNAAQTGDSPLAGIVMMIAVASGICFASVNIKRTLKK